jgi:leucyl aminopeptidase
VKKITLPVIDIGVKKSSTNSNTQSAENDKLIIDLKRPYISISKITTKLASSILNKPTCICITAIPDELKKIFINYLSKAIYRFDKYVTRKVPDVEVYLHDNENTIKNFSKFLSSIKCADVSRNLENEPPNMLSPDTFCKVVRKIFKTVEKKTGTKVRVSVMNELQMQKEGLNLVLSIGLSSKRMPRFMTIECIRDSSYPTICLVGKTVVYDAGGLNIKINGMTPEMKTDKTGGSVVVAIIKFFAENKVNCNVVGILPIVENLLSEDVTRPGDIITSYSGKTVEITDTDAEGRLIMADAISYSKKFNPTYLFDLATLTGWSESVHMDTNAVCYCKNMNLAAKVNEVGERVGERVWFLPPWDEYTYYTQSKVANVRNYNMDMREGAYLPSMFLLTFVPLELQNSYVHFDICNNFKSDLSRGNCVVLVIELIQKLYKSV